MQITCQKQSHQVYILQDAYVGYTTIPPASHFEPKKRGPFFCLLNSHSVNFLLQH